MTDFDPPIFGHDDESTGSTQPPSGNPDSVAKSQGGVQPPLPADEPATSDGPSPTRPASGSDDHETQWDIIKRQFGKNRAAVWGLRVAILLVLIAIYAPLIASAQPFLYSAADGDTTSPWITSLLDENVWPHVLDRLFNIGMAVIAAWALIRFVGRKFAGWGAEGTVRLRKIAIWGGVGLAVAHALFDVGATKKPATEYRTAIDSVKEAEDMVQVAPIAKVVTEDVAAAGADYLALDIAVTKATDALRVLKSRAASRVLPSVADLRTSMQAAGGEVDFAFTRMARGANLLLSEEQIFERGLDRTLDPRLREVWENSIQGVSKENPILLIDARSTALETLGTPEALGLRTRLQQEREGVQAKLLEAVERFGNKMTHAKVPTLAEAEAELKEARASRANTTIVFPPIPYGYREQLPHGYDRFRGTMDFARGERHLLGTDEKGRDVFARILYGTRISLTIGLFAVSIYVLIGMIMGALAGYFRGWVDMVIMRTVEILICIPGLFLILTIVAFFDNRSIWLIMFAIAIVAWTGITRLVRGEFLRERNSEYVLAAQAMGFSTPRIIFRHVLPNSVGPVIVAATFGIAGAILTESGLSFLGLGDVSVPSWGGVLNSGRIDTMWHMIIPPSVAIFITVTSLNLVGDGVRDALDPKLRN